jgi:hypothetical protein
MPSVCEVHVVVVGVCFRILSSPPAQGDSRRRAASSDGRRTAPSKSSSKRITSSSPPRPAVTGPATRTLNGASYSSVSTQPTEGSRPAASRRRGDNSGGGGRETKDSGISDRGQLQVLSQEDALSEREVDNLLSRLTSRSQDVLDIASQGTVNFLRRLGGKSTFLFVLKAQ